MGRISNIDAYRAQSLGENRGQGTDPGRVPLTRAHGRSIWEHPSHLSPKAHLLEHRAPISGKWDCTTIPEEGMGLYRPDRSRQNPALSGRDVRNDGDLLRPRYRTRRAILMCYCGPMEENPGCHRSGTSTEGPRGSIWVAKVSPIADLLERLRFAARQLALETAITKLDKLPSADPGCACLRHQRTGRNRRAL
jgi:hypothetical protein